MYQFKQAIGQQPPVQSPIDTLERRTELSWNNERTLYCYFSGLFQKCSWGVLTPCCVTLNYFILIQITCSSYSAGVTLTKAAHAGCILVPEKKKINIYNHTNIAMLC